MCVCVCVFVCLFATSDGAVCAYGVNGNAMRKKKNDEKKTSDWNAEWLRSAIDDAQFGRRNDRNVSTKPVRQTMTANGTTIGIFLDRKCIAFRLKLNRRRPVRSTVLSVQSQRQRPRCKSYFCCFEFRNPKLTKFRKTRTRHGSK